MQRFKEKRWKGPKEIKNCRREKIGEKGRGRKEVQQRRASKQKQMF